MNVKQSTSDTAVKRADVVTGKCYRLVNSRSNVDGDLYIASRERMINLRDGNVRFMHGNVVDSDRWLLVHATVVENYYE